MSSPANMPKLSILVATYNLEAYICECIDSLLAQSYPNVEIVVVDDGSTDRTREILEQYHQRGAITLHLKENGGTGSVRNFMLERINSEFFTFVDGDDVVSPNCFADNMHLFANPNIDVVQYPILFGWQSDTPYENRPKPKLLDSPRKILNMYMTQEVTFCMCDKIYRRSTFEGLRFKEGIFYEDVDSSGQIVAMMRNMAVSDRGLYYYRRTANSNITRTMTFKKMHDYFCVIFDFLVTAQANHVNKGEFYTYISRWLRLKDFLVYSTFTQQQQAQLQQCVSKVTISKLELIGLLLSSKLSLKKFKVLQHLANGNLSQAITLSNR